MIRRVLAVIGLAWALGFAAFMLLLGEPAGATRTDAIVVPTGGAGRIDRGVALLRAKAAGRMLVTGVGSGVRRADLARTNRAPPAIFACCVDLGVDAVDTRSNAAETARWVRDHRYRSIRLVTSDWHMARARMELGAALDDDVTIIGDGVPTEPRLMLLVNEYNKLLLRRVALWLGVGG